MANLRIDNEGPGQETPADIQHDPELEIMNPDLHLMTLDENSTVHMELLVGIGRSYVSAEAHNFEQDTIGIMPVDSIFSPIRKVNYNVERTRIGQISNFDRLVLEVWTDGTISPVEALSTSAQLLVKHLALVAEFGDITVDLEPEVEESRIPDRIAEANIEDLDLSVRAFNCLKRAGITKVGEILEKLERDEDELLAIRNFGTKSLDELKEQLAAKGFWPLPAE